MKHIESKDNPSYRRIERIRRQKPADDDSMLFLEGLRLCRDAIGSGVAIHQLILAQRASLRPDILDLVRQVSPDEETLELADHLFDRLTETKHPQGIAMLCHRPAVSSDQAESRPDGIYLALEGVADPGNVGTLVRTADAFGFDGVLVLPGTANPFSQKAIRSAMGSCFHIPIIQMTDLAALRSWLAGSGLSLFAADLSGESILEHPFDRPGVILIGNEAHGISDAARDACDRLVTIPMPGKAESLNAAAAGAILCHELRRHHR